MDKQFKVFNSEVKGIDDREGTLTALISTGSKDRMDESLDPMGMNKKNYDKNPVVLFGHQYDQPPIGKALWTKKSADGITAKVKFADTQFAQEIFDLYKGGFMRAFSVGFLPNMDKIEQGDGKKKARRTFKEWELLEFSAVPVPANPEALTLAMEKGILKSEGLKELFKKEIEEEPIIATVPKKEEEKKDTATDNLVAEIVELKKENIELGKQINSLKYEALLKAKEQKHEKTLSEMSVSEVQKIIEDIVDGGIRKAQGKVD